MLDELKAGFRFEERMSGTYHLLATPEEEHRFSFTAQATVGNVMQYLRDLTASLQGTLEMEGFADQVPLEGSLEVNPIFGRALRYQFSFTGNDGQRYRFAGQKDLQVLDLPGSLATLPGAVYDEGGTEVARVLAKFDTSRDLLPFLLSWRPVLPFMG
jgi:hypothetical protein